MLRDLEHSGGIVQSQVAHLGRDDLFDSVFAALDLLGLLADVGDDLLGEQKTHLVL